MNLTEKVAYLKGLAEGMELEDKKQGKLLLAIIDTLDSMAQTIADNEAELTELTAQVDEIDEDLATVEDDFYGDEDEFYDDEDEDDHCDCGCEDDDEEEEEFYEVECPECGETIYLDEDLLKEDFIVCPNCNTEIELEFEDDCDCGCDCEDCKEEAEEK